MIGQIDDLEAAVAERYVPVRPYPPTVRTTGRLTHIHGVDDRERWALAIEAKFACYSTHLLTLKFAKQNEAPAT